VLASSRRPPPPPLTTLWPPPPPPPPTASDPPTFTSSSLHNFTPPDPTTHNYDETLVTGPPQPLPSPLITNPLTQTLIQHRVPAALIRRPHVAAAAPSLCVTARTAPALSPPPPSLTHLSRTPKSESRQGEIHSEGGDAGRVSALILTSTN
jgi:hypothetical protein